MDSKSKVINNSQPRSSKLLSDQEHNTKTAQSKQKAVWDPYGVKPEIFFFGKTKKATTL